MAQSGTVKDLITQAVSEALKRLKLEAKFAVEYPSFSEHGDYSTNVALILASKLKKSPVEIAYQITADLPQQLNMFERVEVTGSGFINFFLHQDFVRSQIKNISDKNFGELKLGDGQKVNIEFISANPTGPLTVGNSRGAFFGDALGNIMHLAGYDVAKEYYVNDAKSSNQIRELGRTALGKGEAYKSDYLDRKLEEFKKKGFKIETLDEVSLGHLIASSIHEDIEEFVKEQLKIKFDKWFHEQTLFDKEVLDKILNDLKKRDLIYEKDGALWLKTTQFGDLQDQVVVRSEAGGQEGQPTYFLSDIGYHADKFKRKYDIVIDVLGPDHQGHIKRMEAVGKMLGFKGKFILLFTQIVRFKEGGLAMRLSKRLGQTVNLEWLLEQVGLDSARYFFLTKSIDTHMDFDVDLAKSKTLQNPVFYIQYAHARLSSILRKAKEQKLNSNFKNIGLLNAEGELQLVKKLLRFPELVATISQDYQVHALTHYLLSVATAANSFYEKERIISEEKELSEARLCLIEAAKNVIFKALKLLGMNAPLKM
ncbi:arginine--tRNA ligase [Candidatus Parcubacteria bacterium]|nr:MAG: arginine--tRNA ligase [Candidatus Parcubacteria bacterium]